MMSRQFFTLTRTILFIIISTLFSSCSNNERIEYSYYENGNIEGEAYYNDNEIEKLRTYYPNGNLKDIILYEDGQINGKRVTIMEDSSQQISYWKDNVQDGIVEHFFSNGKLYSRYYYKKGKLHGPLTIYYKNGNIKFKCHLLNGKLTGDAVMFFEDVERISSEEHIITLNGEKSVTNYTKYNKDGTVLDKTPYPKLEVSGLKDSIRKNVAIELKMKIYDKRFSKTRIVYGSFDDNFQIKDSASLDTVNFKNDIAQLVIRDMEEGWQSIKLLVENYKEKTKNDTLVTYSSFTRYEFPYFVE